jgi:hypothetical protein
VLGDLFATGDGGGHSIAELAVLIPLTLVILLGVFTYSMAFHKQVLVTQTAGATMGDMVKALANQLAEARLFPGSTH